MAKLRVSEGRGGLNSIEDPGDNGTGGLFRGKKSPRNRIDLIIKSIGLNYR